MSRGMTMAWCITLHLLGLLGAPAAHAEPGASAGAPRFAFLDAPGPPLPDLPPQPTREADEYPRRVWEAFPSGGVSTPFCRGSAYGAGHCADATTGATLGIGGLYRVSPYIAVGFDASLVRFTLHGAGDAPRSHASFVGLLVRGYFFDRGVFDPYVETGFGQGAAVARHVERATENGGLDGASIGAGGAAAGDIEVRTEFAAPAVMAGAGIDFWLAPYLRMGPALSYRFSWISTVQGCWGTTCTSVGVDERGAVGSYATVSVRATIALGREM
jgi:hypothetical protein